MKKSEIKVGGHYTAKVSGKLTTVRVDSMGENSLGKMTYTVTNLTTRCKATFHSAVKFRSAAGGRKEDEQRPDPTPANSPASAVNPLPPATAAPASPATVRETASELVELAEKSNEVNYQEHGVEAAIRFQKFRDTSISSVEKLMATAGWQTSIDTSASSDYVRAFREDEQDVLDDFTVRISGHQAHHGGFEFELRVDKPDRIMRELTGIVERLRLTANFSGGLPSQKGFLSPVDNIFCPTPDGSKSATALTDTSATAGLAGLNAAMSPLARKLAAAKTESSMDEAPHLIVEARAGCLAIGTVINVNRAGKGFQMGIETMAQQFNGVQPTFVREYLMRGKTVRSVQKSRPWDLSIPTFVARAEGPVVRLGKLKNAWASGEKETFTITTETGRCVRATAIHPFLTESGEWLQLQELEPGTILQVNIGRGKKGGGPKTQYPAVASKFHPNQTSNGDGRFKGKTTRRTKDPKRVRCG